MNKECWEFNHNKKPYKCNKKEQEEDKWSIKSYKDSEKKCYKRKDKNSREEGNNNKGVLNSKEDGNRKRYKYNRQNGKKEKRNKFRGLQDRMRGKE